MVYILFGKSMLAATRVGGGVGGGDGRVGSPEPLNSEYYYSYNIIKIYSVVIVFPFILY